MTSCVDPNGDSEHGSRLPSERDLPLVQSRRPTIREAMTALRTTAWWRAAGSGIYVTDHPPAQSAPDDSTARVRLTEERRCSKPKAAALAATIIHRGKKKNKVAEIERFWAIRIKGRLCEAERRDGGSPLHPSR